MLKLISAFDMDFNNVIDYHLSFFKETSTEEIDYIEALEEYRNINSYAIFLAGKAGEEIYWKWLNKYEKNFYYLIDDKNPNHIIGYGNIKDIKTNNSDRGLIGYGIRPSNRKKGYGTILLTLLLKKCEELGYTKVSVSCLENNIGSKKIIEHNLGELDKRFFDDDSGYYGLKYWINLEPTINNQIKRLFK